MSPTSSDRSSRARRAATAAVLCLVFAAVVTPALGAPTGDGDLDGPAVTPTDSVATAATATASDGTAGDDGLDGTANASSSAATAGASTGGEASNASTDGAAVDASTDGTVATVDAEVSVNGTAIDADASADAVGEAVGASAGGAVTVSAAATGRSGETGSGTAAPSESDPDEERTGTPTSGAIVASGGAEPAPHSTGAPTEGGTPLDDAGAAAAGIAVAGVLTGAAARTATAVGATPPTGGRTAARVASTARTALSELPRIVPLGYSRYDDSDPLEHDVRADLYEAITEDPGTNLSDLAAGVSVSLSSVRHHLEVLVDEDLVAVTDLYGERCYFPVEERDRALAAALDKDSTAAVLEGLAEEGPASVSRLATVLDRDPSTVSHHLSRLADAGVVEKHREGRAVVSTLTPAARRVLAHDADAGRATASDD